MNVEATVKALRAKGKPSAAKIYAKHGVTGETCGVPYADLNALAKKIGTDHTLALALWKTKLHDARVLATKVAAPERMSKTEITSWLADCEYYGISDAVSSIAVKVPGAEKLAREWASKKNEWTAAAGWNVYAALALEGQIDAKEGKKLLTEIKKDIHAAKNRVRHSMNGTLIALGGSMPELREAALAAAKSIGKVVVDHGDTGCVTPDAAGYIQKMAARQTKSRGK
jgi:3-methyladenine DNA glycosylase AlkD